MKETISFTITSKRIKYLGINLLKEANFLVVQWLRHHVPNAGNPGLIPGQRTRSHMPKLSSGTSCSSYSKESAFNVGDPGLIPGSGRSSGERNGNPLQYSCLENPMDRGVWRATVHAVAKSQTQLRN